MIAVPTLDQVLAEVDRLPSPPTVVGELIQALRDENIVVERLAEGIARDQVLAARALRVANSSFYGVGRKIASIHDAIVVLGFRAVGSLVLAASVTGYLRPRADVGFDLSAFWRHGIGTALCARALARRAGLDGESGFTAGLLHDIGRLMLVTAFPDCYGEVTARRAACDCATQEAEREVLGFDHAAAGAALAERWRLPPEITRAIASHHAPKTGTGRTLADVVHVANAIAHALDLSGEPEDMVPPIDAGSWRGLGIDRHGLLALFNGVEREHEGYGALLAD